MQPVFTDKHPDLRVSPSHTSCCYRTIFPSSPPSEINPTDGALSINKMSAQAGLLTCFTEAKNPLHCNAVLF